MGAALCDTSRENGPLMKIGERGPSTLDVSIPTVMKAKPGHCLKNDCRFLSS